MAKNDKKRIDFESLGFKVPKVLKHKNGCEILLPDNEYSSKDDYCVTLPDGFTFIGISKEHAFRIVSQFCR